MKNLSPYVLTFRKSDTNKYLLWMSCNHKSHTFNPYVLWREMSFPWYPQKGHWSSSDQHIKGLEQYTQVVNNGNLWMMKSWMLLNPHCFCLFVYLMFLWWTYLFCIKKKTCYFNIFKIIFLKVWTERSTQKRYWQISSNRINCPIFSTIRIPLGQLGIIQTIRTDNLICIVTVSSRPKNREYSLANVPAFWK